MGIPNSLLLVIAIVTVPLVANAVSIDDFRSEFDRLLKNVEYAELNTKHGFG